jgi:hypothetical protein
MSATAAIATGRTVLDGRAQSPVSTKTTSAGTNATTDN